MTQKPMFEPNKRICDACHNREATHHTVTIMHSVDFPRSLCSDCFEEYACGAAHELVASLEKSRCNYCGAKASVAESDPLQAVLGTRATRHMCFSCSEESRRYTRTIVARLPKGMSRAEELAAIRNLSEDVDRHMKQWISRGENPGIVP